MKDQIQIYKGYSTEKGGNKNKAVGTVKVDIAKKRFLELYMQTGNVRKTCDILGIVPRNIYNWKAQDEQFVKDMEMASKVALQMLEDEAHRRAYFGVEKPIYQGGKLAGMVREYSDTLMIVLLKGLAPEKYRERWSGELSGANGQPLNPATINHVHSNVPIVDDEKDIDYNKSLIKPSIFEEADVIPPVGSAEEEELLGPTPAKPEQSDIQADELLSNLD